MAAAFAVCALAAASASAEVIKNYTHGGGSLDSNYLWHEDVPVSPWILPYGKPIGWENWPASQNVLKEFKTTTGTACHSAGAAAGEVVTEPLTDEVGYLNKKKKEIGLLERPTTGTAFAQFTCGSETVEIRGAHIGKLSPVNKTIKEGGVLNDEVTAGSTGKDTYTHFEGGKEEVLEVSVNGSPFVEIPISDSGTFETEEGSIEVKGNGKTPATFVTKPKKKK